jgi:hypothetical protein
MRIVLLSACKDIGLSENMGKLSTWKQYDIKAYEVYEHIT